MTMCFQQMAFCSEPSGGISPPSSGCYLTAHLLLWSPLTETPLTPSPPHPTEANQLGSSPGQELLAVRIASGLVRHRHRESVMRRSGVIVCILSVRPLMTKSLSVLPLTIMTNNQLLHHCHNLPPPATAACYQSSVFSPPGSALWIQLDEWAVLGRAHRDQTWWLSLELDSLPQPVWCERVITSVCLVWPLFYFVFLRLSACCCFKRTWWKNASEYCKAGSYICMCNVFSRNHIYYQKHQVVALK